MSRPRCFFLKTTLGAWLGFLAVYFGMCAVWPELLGIGVGIGLFYIVFFAAYKAFGG